MIDCADLKVQVQSQVGSFLRVDPNLGPPTFIRFGNFFTRNLFTEE